MKLPRPRLPHIPAIWDADDVKIAGSVVIVAVLLVGAAATAGLAWTVFQWAGGL